jgi:DNA-directed RNA polymerase subunit RPC12/RpoP
MAIYKCPHCGTLIIANSNTNNCTACGNHNIGYKPVYVSGTDYNDDNSIRRRQKRCIKHAGAILTLIEI